MFEIRFPNLFNWDLVVRYPRGTPHVMISHTMSYVFYHGRHLRSSDNISKNYFLGGLSMYAPVFEEYVSKRQFGVRFTDNNG